MAKRPGLIATGDTLPVDQDRLKIAIDAHTINITMQFTFDPRKDAANIVKKRDFTERRATGFQCTQQIDA